MAENEVKLASSVYMQERSALQALRRILNTWTELVEKYASGMDDDLPYWYTERANVGLLSAAVWMAGGMALEEYSDLKADPNGKHDDYAGRVDLMLEWKNNFYVAEAKQIWVRLDREPSRSMLQDQMLEGLAEAKADVVRSPRYGGQRVALLFATPIVCGADWEESTHEFLEAARDLDVDFVAWANPFRVPPPRKDDPRWCEERFYPGVALLGRVPRRPA